MQQYTQILFLESGGFLSTVKGLCLCSGKLLNTNTDQCINQCIRSL